MPPKSAVVRDNPSTQDNICHIASPLARSKSPEVLVEIDKNKRPFMQRLFLGAVLPIALYFLALVPRLGGLANDGIQSDEIHWVRRSQIVASHAAAGRWEMITNHLGHPGIPPTIIMALGQTLAEQWDKKTSPGAGSLVDRYTASRTAVALTSSLAIPILYFAAAPAVGTLGGFGAAALLALDPSHIALSRQAHLDAVLATLVLLCVLSYLRAVELNSSKWKIVAGAVWGLCISTKPTALALIPGFVAYKFLRNWFDPQQMSSETEASNTEASVTEASIIEDSKEAQFPKQPARERTLVSVGDVLAVLTGHLVFLGLYTRWWLKDRNKLNYHNVESQFADALLLAGEFLRSHGILLFTVILALGGTSYLLRRRALSQRSLLAAVLAPIFLALAVVPHVFANIARFWTWALGLSSIKHKAWGMTWEPLRFGYWEMLATRLPSAVVCLLGFFALSFCCQVVRRRGQAVSERLIYMAPMVVLAWLLLLQASDKQSLRYCLPVFPLLYLCASSGLLHLTRLLGRFFGSTRMLACVLLASLTLAQVLTLLQLRPNYELFFNALSGGLQGAKERNYPMPIAGATALADYLAQLLQRPEAEQIMRFGVRGDADALTRTFARRHPQLTSRLNFQFSKTMLERDYLVTTGSFHTPVARHLSSWHPAAEELFSYSVQNVPLLTLYRTPQPDYRQPYSFSLGFLPQKIGGRMYRRDLQKILAQPEQQVLSFDTDEVSLFALPQQNKKGFLLFGLEPRLAPGTYQLRASLALLAPKNGSDLTKVSALPEISPARYVVRIDFGGCARREVTYGELADAIATIPLNCHFPDGGEPQLRVYWFGSVGVGLTRLELERVEK